jgi:hypothetical protein
MHRSQHRNHDRPIQPRGILSAIVIWFCIAVAAAALCSPRRVLALWDAAGFSAPHLAHLWTNPWLLGVSGVGVFALPALHRRRATANGLTRCIAVAPLRHVERAAATIQVKRLTAKRSFHLREVVFSAGAWLCLVLGWLRVLRRPAGAEEMDALRLIILAAAIYAAAVSILIYRSIKRARSSDRPKTRLEATPAKQRETDLTIVLR